MKDDDIKAALNSMLVPEPDPQRKHQHIDQAKRAFRQANIEPQDGFQWLSGLLKATVVLAACVVLVVIVPKNEARRSGAGIGSSIDRSKLGLDQQHWLEVFGNLELLLAKKIRSLECANEGCHFSFLKSEATQNSLIELQFKKADRLWNIVSRPDESINLEVDQGLTSIAVAIDTRGHVILTAGAETWSSGEPGLFLGLEVTARVMKNATQEN